MIKCWQDFIREHLIQTVPTEQSYCAFDCRRLSCEGCLLMSSELGVGNSETGGQN